MDKSPTDTADQDAGDAQKPSLPADPADNSADDSQDTATVPKDETPKDGSDSAAAQPADDNNQKEIEAFAKAQGIDIENPTKDDLVRLAKVAKDNVAAYRQSSQKDSELRKEVKDSFGVSPSTDDDDLADPLQKRVQELEQYLVQSEMDRRVSEFYIGNPEAAKLDSDMAKLVKEKPHLRGDLDTLYKLAKLNSDGAGLDAAKASGRQEERELIAQRQRASSAEPSALDTSPSSPNSFTRDQIDSMSDEDYTKNRDAIVAAEKAGRIR